jgi:hypothetical protein
MFLLFNKDSRGVLPKTLGPRQVIMTSFEDEREGLPGGGEAADFDA